MFYRKRNNRPKIQSHIKPWLKKLFIQLIFVKPKKDKILFLVNVKMVKSDKPPCKQSNRRLVAMRPTDERRMNPGSGSFGIELFFLPLSIQLRFKKGTRKIQRRRR